MGNRLAICCFAFVFSLVYAGSVPAEEKSTFVRDLTHKLHPGIPQYPNNLQLTVNSFLGSVNGAVYKSENISSSTHIGTHVDAPSYYANGSWNIDEIPLDRLFAPAVVIDIRYKSLKYPNAELSVSDLLKWESEHGKIPNGAVILVRTGWDKFWNDSRKYLSISDEGSRTTPGISGEAAKWIVQDTSAYGVGIDSFSVDSNDNSVAHLILCRYSLYIIVNLKDLDKVPTIGATLYVMPIKIKNASGAPARVIATYPV